MSSTDLVLPTTGEVVEWEDVNSLARALDWVRGVESELRSAKASLQQAIAEQARIQGTKTLALEDGRKAIVSGGTRVSWDAQALYAGLVALGMPQERILEIVQVEYKVNANEAKRAAGANPEYAVLVEACRHEEPAPVSVSLRS
jgi:hypothetical protein